MRIIHGFIGMDVSRYNRIMKSGRIDLTNGSWGHGVYIGFDEFVAGSYGSKIVPVIVKVSRIKEIDFQDVSMMDEQEYKKFVNDISVDNLKRNGYDALIVSHTTGGRKYPINGESEILVFDSKKVIL